MEQVTRFDVTGLTCSGCAGGLIRSVGAAVGVTDVEVDLRPGERSTLILTHVGPLDDEAVRRAVARAGFSAEGTDSAGAGTRRT